jgi:hypothetical protein
MMKKLSILALPLVLASYLPAQQTSASPAQSQEPQQAFDDAERTKRAKPPRTWRFNTTIGTGTGWRYAPTGADLTRTHHLSEQNSYAGISIGNVLRKDDSLDIAGWNTCTIDGRILETPKRDCSEADAIVRYTSPLGRFAKGDLSSYAGVEEWNFVSGDLGTHNTIFTAGLKWMGPYGITVEVSTNTILIGDYAGGFAGVVSTKKSVPVKTFANKSHLDATVGGEFGGSHVFFDDISAQRVVRGEVGASYTWTSGTAEMSLGAKWRPQLSLTPVVTGMPPSVASTPEWQVGYSISLPLRK